MPVMLMRRRVGKIAARMSRKDGVAGDFAHAVKREVGQRG